MPSFPSRMIWSRASIRCGRAAALGAHLHDPLVLAGRGQHGLALGHVDADRLLDINIGARLDGRDHRQGVPVVGRGDQDDVQVLLLEHLAVVGEGARSLLRGLPVGDDVGGLGQHLLVDVAQRDDLDRRDLDQPEQVRLAVPAAADQSHALGFPAGRAEGSPRRSCEREARGRRAGLKELATIHGAFFPWLFLSVATASVCRRTLSGSSPIVHGAPRLWVHDLRVAREGSGAKREDGSRPGSRSTGIVCVVGRASDAIGNERSASSMKAARAQSPIGSVAKWA